MKKSLEAVFWKIFPFLLLLLLFIIIKSIFNYYNSLVPKENVMQAVGVVRGYDHRRKSNSVLLVFKSKGNSFVAKCSGEYNIGEKFIVEYEEKNPRINQVQLDKPIFFKMEKTSTTVGIVTNYNPNYFKNISFVYFINGEKYQQSYQPVENSEIKYPNLKKNQKYIVKYWNEDPKRSILLLDKPTNKLLEMETLYK